MEYAKKRIIFVKMRPLKINAVKWEPEDNASESKSDELNFDIDSGCVPH